MICKLNLSFILFDCMHFCVQTDPNHYGPAGVIEETPPSNGAHRRILATPSPVVAGSGSGSSSGSSSSHEDAAPHAPPRTPPRAARRLWLSMPQAVVLPPAPAPAQRRIRRTERQMLRAANREMQQVSLYWRTPPRRLRNSARGYDNLQSS